MPVEISASCSPALRPLLVRAGEVVLTAAGHEDDELSIALLEDREIRDLNRDYRGEDRATDVLSFSQMEGAILATPTNPREGTHLGDVVISLETARRQAEAGGWSVEEEVVRLLVHGTLHLLGYDHERDAREARRMQTEEIRLAGLLAAAGVACAGEGPA